MFCCLLINMGNYIYGITDTAYMELIENIDTQEKVTYAMYYKSYFEQHSEIIFEKLFEKNRFDLIDHIIMLNPIYKKHAYNLFTNYSLDYKFHCSDLIHSKLHICVDIDYIYDLSDKINTYHLDYYLKYLNIVEYEKLIEKLIIGHKNPDLIEIILKKLVNIDFSYLILQCIVFDNIAALKLFDKYSNIEYIKLFIQCCIYDSIKCAKYIHYETERHKFTRTMVNVLLENNSLKIAEWIIKMNKILFDVELFEEACILGRYDFAKLIYENVKIPIEIVNKYE